MNALLRGVARANLAGDDSGALAATRRDKRPVAARGRGLQRTRWWTWLVPMVALTALLTFYPALESIRLSLFEWKGYGAQEWVGLRNYRQFFADPVAQTALWNTAFFAVVTTVGTVVVGTILAMILDRKLPLGRVWRTLIFLPVMLPVVFTGLVWVFNLETSFGWVNIALTAINPELAQGWLSDPNLVMWTISVTTIFQYAGFPMILVLAGLQAISPEVQEAATLDGVSASQRTRLITLPLIRDIVVSVTLLQLLAGFRVFDQVYVMTRGGPGTSSQVMSTYVYREAFRLQHFGLGAAGAVVTCLVVVVISMAYMSVFSTSKMSRA